MKLMYTPAALGLLMTASACTEGFEGTTRYAGPDSVIATNIDKGRDSGPMTANNPGIAYTPDGCQVWFIDDGVEGRSSNRLDPVSGLPICNDRYPPGTVVGTYQSGNEGIVDRVPGSSGVATVIPSQ